MLADLSWTNQEINLPGEYEVVIRYHHAPVKAKLEKVAEAVKISFVEPQRAITLGQLAAIFSGDELVGAGVIAEVL